MGSVEVNGAWGFIDTTRKLVIGPKYYVRNDFTEGLAPVSIKVDSSTTAATSSARSLTKKGTQSSFSKAH
jgi:hypothetical protein